MTDVSYPKRFWRKMIRETSRPFRSARGLSSASPPSSTRKPAWRDVPSSLADMRAQMQALVGLASGLRDGQTEMRAEMRAQMQALAGEVAE